MGHQKPRLSTSQVLGSWKQCCDSWLVTLETEHLRFWVFGLEGEDLGLDASGIWDSERLGWYGWAFGNDLANLVHTWGTSGSSKRYKLEPACNAAGQLRGGQKHVAILRDRNFLII